LFLFVCTYIGGDYEEKKYEYLLVDVKGQNSNVALVQLNRPKALNALCDGLMKEVRAIFIY
jgi:enoyl-CoA hydratase